MSRRLTDKEREDRAPALADARDHRHSGCMHPSREKLRCRVDGSGVERGNDEPDQCGGYCSLQTEVSQTHAAGEDVVVGMHVLLRSY